MGPPSVFFENERSFFFRPLAGKRRELVAACLRALYDRLHGPGADYSLPLTREALKELLAPTVQAHAQDVTADSAGTEDELSGLDSSDAMQVASALCRALERDGWLETIGNRTELVTVYRLTRSGKTFAEALWALENRAARSRQRNVRSCRNALQAALKTLDANDLVDAHDYAERVLSDLSEGVGYFQDLVRRLMSEASRTPWEEFVQFLDRFEKEFKKQLTSDNVELHRQSIREALDNLRALPADRYLALETQLNDIAPWANPDQMNASALDWMLGAIEDRVEAACNSKAPEMLRSMHSYIRRASSIIRHALGARSNQGRQAHLEVIARLSVKDEAGQDQLLDALGQLLACAEIRLVDPASFRLRAQSVRNRASNVTRKPMVSREARLAAAIAKAEAEAFTISNESIILRIRKRLKEVGQPVRLSSLPIETAIDVLQIMQAVEAVRADPDAGVRVTRISGTLENDYFKGGDFLFEFI